MVTVVVSRIPSLGSHLLMALKKTRDGDNLPQAVNQAEQGKGWYSNKGPQREMVAQKVGPGPPHPISHPNA